MIAYAGILLAALTLQVNASVVDSQRAEELMERYQACVQGSPLTLFIQEIEDCGQRGDDSFKGCADAATERLRERTPPTHDSCKKFIPSASEFLRDVAERESVATPNRGDAADTKKRHTNCFRNFCAAFRRS